jgi:hypothetical protein
MIKCDIKQPPLHNQQMTASLEPWLCVAAGLMTDGQQHKQAGATVQRGNRAHFVEIEFERQALFNALLNGQRRACTCHSAGQHSTACR